MKTYLRLLGFARPYADFVPLYALFTTLGIVFGILNFTLLIPLLNVLFDSTAAHGAGAAGAAAGGAGLGPGLVPALPAFAPTLAYGR